MEFVGRRKPFPAASLTPLQRRGLTLHSPNPAEEICYQRPQNPSFPQRTPRQRASASDRDAAPGAGHGGCRAGGVRKAAGRHSQPLRGAAPPTGPAPHPPLLRGTGQRGDSGGYASALAPSLLHCLFSDRGAGKQEKVLTKDLQTLIFFYVKSCYRKQLNVGKTRISEVFPGKAVHNWGQETLQGCYNYPKQSTESQGNSKLPLSRKARM